MECQACFKSPEFYCPCSDKLLCSTHLSQHYQTPNPHNIENLTIEINSSIKSCLIPELKSRISTLNDLKHKIQQECSYSIKTINILCSSALSKIDSTIKNYLQKIQLTKTCSSLQESLRKIIRTELKIKTFSLQDLNDLIHKKIPIHEDLFTLNLKDLRPFRPIDSNLNSITQANENWVYYRKDSNRNKFLLKHSQDFCTFSVSYDGKFLAAGSNDASIRVWSLSSYQLVACLIHHKKSVYSVSFSKDNFFIASGSEDRTVVLRDLYQMKIKNVYFGHTDNVVFVCFEKENKNLVSASNQEILIWNVDKNECLKDLRLNGFSCGVLTSENILYLGIGSFLVLWNLTSLQEISKISISNNKSLNSINLSKSEKLILTSTTGKSIQIYESSTTKLKFSLLCDSEQNSLSTTPSDQTLLTSSYNQILVWDLERQIQLHRIPISSSGYCIFTVLQNEILISCLNKCIQIFSIPFPTASMHLLQHISLESFNQSSLFFNENFVSYGQNNSVLIYNLDTQQVLFNLGGHFQTVTCTCISINSQYLISGSLGSDQNLVLWDFCTRSLLNVFQGHYSDVTCVDISDNEDRAVSGDISGRFIVWRLGNFEVFFNECAHDGALKAVKFLNHGEKLVSAGIDCKVFVWSVEGKCLKARFDVDVRVERVLDLASELMFAVVEDGGGFKVFDLKTWDLQRSFRAIQDRNEWVQRFKMFEEDVVGFLGLD